MNFEQLKAAEPAFKLKKGDPSKLEAVGISNAGDPVAKTMIFVKNNRFLTKVLDSKMQASVGVVLQESFYDSLNEDAKSELETLAEWVGTVENVDAAMCSLSRPFYDEKFSNLNYHVDGRQMGTAKIDPEAEIAQNVFIGEGCVIEANTTIMPGCVIMPNSTVREGSILFGNVTVYPYVTIGRNCRVHSNVVLGADGFGYNFLGGKHQKVWHFGGVEIGDDVEIGASSSVDAGAFSPTLVGEGTKLDNFVQIAHNCKVGKHCVLCGRAGLAGSVTLEDYVVIGAAGGCAPGALLKQGTQVAAMAVVSENSVWGPKETLAGHPARPLKEWLKKQARLNRLANDMARHKA